VCVCAREQYIILSLNNNSALFLVPRLAIIERFLSLGGSAMFMEVIFLLALSLMFMGHPRERKKDVKEEKL
jgi:hypothetical protein